MKCERLSAASRSLVTASRCWRRRSASRRAKYSASLRCRLMRCVIPSPSLLLSPDTTHNGRSETHHGPHGEPAEQREQQRGERADQVVLGEVTVFHRFKAGERLGG